jgi:hypothetical protein
MRNNARIEQGHRFERILVHEARTDELPLRIGELSVCKERHIHFRGAGYQSRLEVAMAALEIL